MKLKSAILLLSCLVLIVGFSGCVNQPTGQDKASDTQPSSEYYQPLLHVKGSGFKVNKDMRLEADVKFYNDYSLKMLDDESGKFILTDESGNSEIVPAVFEVTGPSQGSLIAENVNLELQHGNINIKSSIVSNDLEHLSPAESKFELINGSSFECITLLENAPKAEKVNILVLASGYSSESIEMFEDEAKKRLGLIEGKWHIGLMRVKPFSENSENINLYSMKNYADLSPGAIKMVSDEDYMDTGRLCGVIPDFVIVIVHGNKSYTEFIGGNLFFTPDSWLQHLKDYHDNCEVDGEWICDDSPLYLDAYFLHEFGHLFAQLGDEYEVLRYDYHPLAANLDSEFCPKWCSGQPDKDAPCYPEYKQITDCFKIKGERITNQEIWSCMGENYDLLFNCNIGKDCLAGTGCYLGAGAINKYRAYTDFIMDNSPKLKPEYGIISEGIIQQVIDEIIRSK